MPAIGEISSIYFLRISVNVRWFFKDLTSGSFACDFQGVFKPFDNAQGCPRFFKDFHDFFGTCAIQYRIFLWGGR